MVLSGENRFQMLKVLIFYTYSCFLVMCFAIETIVMVYIVEVKTLLHLNQTQVEIISAMYLLGIFFVLPFYPMYHRLGFYLTSVIIFLLTEVGVALLALALHMPAVFSQLSALVSIFQFMVSNGHTFIYVLVLQVTTEIIPRNHTGKALGICASMLCVGQILYTAMYNAWFADIEKTTSFFLLMLIIGCGIRVVYVLVHAVTIKGNKIQDEDEERLIKNDDYPEVMYGSQNTINHVTNDDQFAQAEAKSYECLEAPEDEPNTAETDVNGNNSTLMSKPKEDPVLEGIGFPRNPLALSCNGIFHFFLWPGAMNMCLCYIFQSNIGLILQSMDMVDKNNLIVITMTAFNLFARVTSGFVYDRLGVVHRKLLLLAFASTLSILSLLLAAIWTDNLVILLVSVSFMGLSLGMSYSTTYALGADIFGVHNNVFVQAIKLTVTGGLVAAFSIMVGVIYDHVTAAEDQQDIVCYGISCYRTSYLIMGLFSTPVPLVFILLARHIKHKVQD